MNQERKKIYYIVMVLDHFAKLKNLTIKRAYEYLNRFGGLDFLITHYEAEHLLSEDEVLEDLEAISKRGGGTL